MKYNLLILSLLLTSFSVQALPLVSVKEQIRDELWHQGLKKDAQVAVKTVQVKKSKPRLNEELHRALNKYQL